MKRAFSLVELSIVLVILGLLVGGVLSGQALIRAAELRSVSSDFNKFQTALHTFKDKYFGVPGDMNTATRFWGRQMATGPCVTNSGASVNATTGVCDGDGNGLIDNIGGTAGQNYETYQSVRHLANAGLIEGTYSGVWTAPYGPVRGTNSPASKITSSAVVGISQMSPSSPNFLGPFYYTMDYGNAIGIASPNGNGILTPEEAWNIDTKMDDGKPAMGKIVAMNWDTCTTSATTNDLTGVYDFSVKTQECFFTLKNAI